jgi:hypothetical protein
MKPVLHWVLKQPTRKNSYVLTEKLERSIERENEIKEFQPHEGNDQTNFWCLFGVYYWSAPERLKRIKSTNEKIRKL